MANLLGLRALKVKVTVEVEGIGAIDIASQRALGYRHKPSKLTEVEFEGDVERVSEATRNVLKALMEEHVAFLEERGDGRVRMSEALRYVSVLEPEPDPEDVKKGDENVRHDDRRPPA